MEFSKEVEEQRKAIAAEYADYEDEPYRYGPTGDSDDELGPPLEVGPIDWPDYQPIQLEVKILFVLCLLAPYFVLLFVPLATAEFEGFTAAAIGAATATFFYVKFVNWRHAKDAEHQMRIKTMFVMLVSLLLFNFSIFTMFGFPSYPHMVLVFLGLAHGTFCVALPMRGNPELWKKVFYGVLPHVLLLSVKSGLVPYLGPVTPWTEALLTILLAASFVPFWIVLLGFISTPQGRIKSTWEQHMMLYEMREKEEKQKRSKRIKLRWQMPDDYIF